MESLLGFLSSKISTGGSRNVVKPLTLTENCDTISYRCKTKFYMVNVPQNNEPGKNSTVLGPDLNSE